MAFFTIEDRVAEIECIAFARQYGEFAHLIHTDSGVFVSGTISLREDEPPKLLVNRMEGLVENGRFRPESVKTERDAARDTAPRDKKMPVVTSASASRPSEPPKRLFLRVPDAKSVTYCKALNLVELFDGAFPTYFFFADEKRYETSPHGVALSDYVLEQLRGLLGVENVILK